MTFSFGEREKGAAESGYSVLLSLTYGGLVERILVELLERDSDSRMASDLADRWGRVLRDSGGVGVCIGRAEQVGASIGIRRQRKSIGSSPQRPIARWEEPLF